MVKGFGNNPPLCDPYRGMGRILDHQCYLNYQNQEM